MITSKTGKITKQLTGIECILKESEGLLLQKRHASEYLKYNLFTLFTLKASVFQLLQQLCGKMLSDVFYTQFEI